jgi:hypothetical protein
MARYRRSMTPIEAAQQLRELEPVPPPPPGPTYDHIVGNQIRWSMKVIRHSRYRRRRRKLEKLAARPSVGDLDV